MMLPTHILAGGVIGLVSSFLTTEPQFSMIIIGMMAGMLPDLDMFFEHRKTLHRPLQFGLIVLILIAAYLVFSSSFLLLLTVVFASASFHAASEIAGQGKTMNPDLKMDDRCVYNHLKHSWIKPRRLVKVASFRDLGLSVLFSIPLVMIGNQRVSLIAIVVLTIGALQFLLNDWLTKKALSDYDRFSEAIQKKIGYGPELKN